MLVQFTIEQLKTNMSNGQGTVAAEAIMCLLELVDSTVLLSCDVDKVLFQIVATELASETDSEVWQQSSKCLVECCSIIADPQRVASTCLECSHIAMVIINQLSSSNQLSICTEHHCLLLCMSECISACLKNKSVLQSANFAQTAAAASQSLISLLKIPSLPLAEIILPTMCGMVSSEGSSLFGAFVQKIEEMQNTTQMDFVILIRELLPNYVSDPEVEEGLQFPHISFSDLSYGDHDTWLIAFEDCRRAARKILSRLYNSSTPQIRNSFSNSMLSLLTELQSKYVVAIPQDPRCSSSGELLSCSRQSVAWESSIYVTSCCLSTDLRYDDVASKSADVIISLLSFKTEDGLIIGHQASLASAVVPFYYSNRQLLISATEMLFRNMNHRRQYESTSMVLSPATETARKTVLATFVKLSRQKNLLQDLVSQLLTSAGQIVTSGVLMAAEISLLYEGLVLVSNGLPTEQQQNILNVISAPVLNQLSELNKLSTVALVTEFITSQSLHTMKHIHQIVATLTGMFRQARHGAFVQLSEQLMEPILLVAKSISKMYGPEGRELLPPSHQSVIVPKIFSSHHEWQSQGGNALITDTDDCRDFLEEIQSCMFELLGRMASVSPSFHQHYAALMPGSIADNISISNAKNYLMHFALPFINSQFAYCGVDNTPNMQHAQSTLKFISGTCRMCGFKIAQWYEIEKLREEPELREIAMMSIDVMSKFGFVTEIEKLLSTHALSSSACIYLIASSLMWENAGPAVKSLSIFNKKLIKGFVEIPEIHPHLFTLFGYCLRKMIQSSCLDMTSVLIGSDTADDQLMTECSLTIVILLSSLTATDFFVNLLLGVGITDAQQLLSSILQEASVASRQALLQSSVSKIAGRQPDLRNVSFPKFKLPQFNAESFYSDVTTVPIEVI